MTTLVAESPFGTHRVAEPVGVLPYQAQRLELDSPLRDHEVRIEVEALNLDSASFVQLKTEAGGDLAKVAAKVQEIVAGRGKMHNPVTGSGGVLIGRVSAVGAARTDLVVGDRLVTLVSLTTTPLALTAVAGVDPLTHQLKATGTAILFERGLFARLPADLGMPEALAMSVLDVCGAPAQAHRLVQPGMRVVILGAGGRSGLLCSWVAANQVGPEGQVVALEFSDVGLQKLAAVARETGVPISIHPSDARDAVTTHDVVAAATGGRMADLVINCVNLPNTEMASILACRPRGTVYFFSMATSFQAAALGAESVGLDIDMLVGNGYAQNHADYALGLVRANPALGDLLV